MYQPLTLYDETILLLKIRRARLLHGVNKELTAIRKQLKSAMVQRTRARKNGKTWIDDSGFKQRIANLGHELAIYQKGYSSVTSKGNTEVTNHLHSGNVETTIDNYPDDDFEPPSDEEMEQIRKELEERDRLNPVANVPKTPFAKKN